MMRIIASLMVVSVLAACGADGRPTRPEPKEKAKAEETVEDQTQTQTSEPEDEMPIDGAVETEIPAPAA